MRSLLPLAFLALAIPTALGHAALPLNGVTNGGFESGWSGWAVAGFGPSLVGGADGTTTGVMTPNGYSGSFVHQALPAPLVGNAGVLLDFHARLGATAGRNGINVIETLTAWNPTSGAGQFTAHVAFRGNQVFVSAWTIDPLGTGVGTAAPSDGGWHHYQVVATGVLGVATLLIDGIPALDGTGMPLLAVGDPASVGTPDRIIFGDVAACDCSLGAAPDVAYDEIWYGPSV